MKINVLESNVYNLIAAGEVVEKPASVVKELVENAIDSGATKINIEIFGGGLNKIVVSDNGCGIEESEIQKAFLPHATSKIKSAKDLENIASLGFRGEALASIAAVSKAKIITKTNSAQNGTSLEVNGGNFGCVEAVGSTNGTTVIISNLFYNTPARLKFMRKSKSEEGDVTNLVSKIILANPALSFTYVADGKTIFTTFGKGLKEALFIIYGKETYENLLELNYSMGEVKISGYIAKPTFAKANRTYQTIFVNGRVVNSPLISAAALNALEGYIMKGKFPLFAINIEIPLSSVDVNVHPNKLEVKFENSQKIYLAISNAIYNAVSKTSFVQENEVNEKPFEFNKAETVSQGTSFNKELNLNSFKDIGLAAFEKKLTKPSPEIKFSQTSNSFLTELVLTAVKDNPIENQQQFEMPKNNTETNQQIFNDMKIIGTVFNTYIVAEKENQIYFIDQHAAHERLLFDKITAQLNDGEMAKQDLLVPFVFKTNSVEEKFIEDNIVALSDFGIEISDFGGGNFKVNTIPYLLADINLKQFFDDVLASCESLAKKPISIIREKFTQMACKAAVKGRQQLSNNEIEKLLTDFQNGNNVLLCPHGRPIVVKISKGEIEKWFKRIV